MTMHAEQAQGIQEPNTRCWCCDAVFEEKELVRLGAHPEVGLCAVCARWVHRRAVEKRDEGRRGIGARSRSAVRG